MLDLDTISPLQKLSVSVGGTEHEVTRLTVREMFEIRGLDEDRPDDLTRIIAILAEHGLPESVFDTLLPEQYSALIRYVMYGPEKADPTTPGPTA